MSDSKYAFGYQCNRCPFVIEEHDTQAEVNALADEHQARCHAPMTSDQLLARLSDVLRRSGVEDAEALVRAVKMGLRAMCPDCGDWQADERGCEECRAKELRAR